MARPTKREYGAKKQRNKRVVKMRENGYPFQYIADYFGLSRGRAYLIYKDNKNKYYNKGRKVSIKN